MPFVHFVDGAQMEVFPIIHYHQGVLIDFKRHTFIYIIKFVFWVIFTF